MLAVPRPQERHATEEPFADFETGGREAHTVVHGLNAGATDQVVTEVNNKHAILLGCPTFHLFRGERGAPTAELVEEFWIDADALLLNRTVVLRLYPLIPSGPAPQHRSAP
ncbi:hypothetical protein [Streptomyces nigrescens]|uniref:hypothetical protein n=1 Tax=Streptomyces nigrescens TaxID=1920 RepID=UPI0021C405FD|nr:hypothetical protein [Streptomyces nigrescens]